MSTTGRWSSIGAVRRRAAVVVVLAVAALGLAGCVPTPAPASSRCSTNAALLVCPHRTTALLAAGEWREVHHQVPRGTPPAAGWPVVIMFQGSVATAKLTWSASPLYPLGGYHQTRTVQYLLDSGFAVLTPETHLGGLTFWDTNNVLVPNYFDSNDHALMLQVFDAIDGGSFGALDGSSLYAAGISSGGYMTSRMALAYPGKFTALAIQSGSYATCAGILCDVGPVPEDHPPTLFLHGALDPVVPIFTMDAYRTKLNGQGTPTRRVVDTFSFHEWIPQAPGEIRAWFMKYS